MANSKPLPLLPPATPRLDKLEEGYKPRKTRLSGERRKPLNR